MYRRITAFMATLVLFSTMTISLASESSEIVDITYVTITGDNFVVDSLNGVDAYYNLYDRYYQCNEYVTRYYSEVYGIDVDTGSSGPTTDAEGYYFEETDEPAAGDILYAPSWKRGKSYSHWAVVKSYSDGVVTIIEQNWRWNGQAAYERQIEYPSGYYDAYTLKGDEVEEEYVSPYYVSAWAQSYVETALGEEIVPVASNYQSSISREEFCELTVNTLSLLGVDLEIPEDAETVEFSDCDSEAVELAAYYGLVEGGEDGMFYPDSPITREESAVILYRAMALCGISDTGETDLSGYSDEAQVSAWAAEAVSALSAQGIMSGSDEGSLEPQEDITREAAIVMEIRLIRYLLVASA